MDENEENRRCYQSNVGKLIIEYSAQNVFVAKVRRKLQERAVPFVPFGLCG